MTDIKEMTKDELLEVIRIKDSLIRELREEIEAYKQIADELIKNSRSVQ